jgi:DNA modification methylase
LNRVEFGDCRQIMQRWIADGVRVNTCVTSPPYFGLRDYGVDGQLGLEATPEEYVASMVDVFRCVRDLLADDGTLWLNLGDSYAGSGRGGHVSNTSTLQGSIDSEQECRKARGSQKAAGYHESMRQAGAVGRAWVPVPAGLKQKDLIGIPWMVAFALRADGWYLRQDIIWAKPNPMPESVTDRCTKAHEYLFLLSKSERYSFDASAMQEPAAPTSVKRWQQNVEDQAGSSRAVGKTNGTMKAVGGPRKRGVPPRHARYPDSSDQSGLDGVGRGETRNRRSVWHVSTKPYKGAHFATFPPDLIAPCVLAGSSMGGIVLDPFMGSGTTAMVALTHGRQFLGCELNPAYHELQQERISGALVKDLI